MNNSRQNLSNTSRLTGRSEYTISRWSSQRRPKFSLGGSKVLAAVVFPLQTSLLLRKCRPKNRTEEEIGILRQEIELLVSNVAANAKALQLTSKTLGY